MKRGVGWSGRSDSNLSAESVGRQWIAHNGLATWELRGRIVSLRAASGGARGKGKRKETMWGFSRGWTDDVLWLWRRWLCPRRAEPGAESIEPVGRVVGDGLKENVRLHNSGKQF